MQDFIDLLNRVQDSDAQRKIVDAIAKYPGIVAQSWYPIWNNYPSKDAFLWAFSQSP